jgi:hypothetical protein
MLVEQHTLHGARGCGWLIKLLKSRRKHYDAHCLTGYDKVMRREVIEPDQGLGRITMSDAVGQAAPWTACCS